MNYFVKRRFIYIYIYITLKISSYFTNIFFYENFKYNYKNLHEKCNMWEIANADKNCVHTYRQVFFDILGFDRILRLKRS